MNSQKRFSFFLALFLLVLPVSGAVVYAGEIDCLKCHAKVKQEQVVHPALDMGCPSCHSAIDAAKVPHRKTNKIGKGLSLEQPDLCYGCHDKEAFSRQNLHAAVSMGCTGCHNPHSSKNAKLLKSDAPDLCYSCHDRKAFTGKTVHAPVEGGMCLSCHTPHSSDQMALLAKKPADVCLECHAEVTGKRHATGGTTSRSHPIVTEKREKVRVKKENGKGWKWTEVVTERSDPSRPGKPFYCGSCHNPHGTDVPRLLKFGAKTSMDLCVKCHNY